MTLYFDGSTRSLQERRKRETYFRCTFLPNINLRQTTSTLLSHPHLLFFTRRSDYSDSTSLDRVDRTDLVRTVRKTNPRDLRVPETLFLSALSLKSLT